MFGGENSKINSRNNEIEDFIYPEIIIDLVNQVLQKKTLKKIPSAAIETKISQAAFKNSGILNLIENEKNNMNPEEGANINIQTISVKNNVAKFFKIEGNAKLIKLIELNDKKYPEVRGYIKKLFEGNL